ncbi:MAG: AMP-binding protein [Rhodobiaceae bacterium]|nr:AMP-binding protein [Rhodobiaceae bacterium]MCC0056635.1 AMP-binding protein [Rhodobiaceae bacterium]
MVSISSEILLPQLIRKQAADNGGKCYLEEVDGLSQTYEEAHSAAIAWARGFSAIGLSAEDRVLMFLPPKIETVNIWLGLGWLRAIAVPVNTEYRGQMLSYVIENSRATVMVCTTGYLHEVLSAGSGGGSALKTIVVLDNSDGFVPPADSKYDIMHHRDLIDRGTTNDDEFQGPNPWDISTVMYTSGTSGVSKGVMITWANFANGGYRMRPEEMTSEDVMYSYLPLYHVGGTFWLNSVAQVSAKMVLKERFSLPDVWPDIRRYQCTITFLLGAAVNFITRQEARPDDADNPLRFAQTQPLPEDVDAFENRFGLKLYTVYGSTEIGVAMRTDFKRINNTTCGRLFPELEGRIVDENDYELPHGQVGELVVRSKEPWIISAGYFEMPEATTGAWRNLWYHSGDGMRRDEDGNFYFVDRIKDSIRRRGENISSLEVEQFVSGFDGILECAAVGVPSEFGEEDLKICIVPKPGRTIDEPSLVSYLVDQKVPRFMVPRYVEILSELPKTVTGKIQKRKLRDAGEELKVLSLWDRESSQGERRKA